MKTMQDLSNLTFVNNIVTCESFHKEYKEILKYKFSSWKIPKKKLNFQTVSTDSLDGVWPLIQRNLMTQVYYWRHWVLWFDD